MAVKKYYFFGSYSGCDPDAIAYLDVAGISNSNDRKSICRVVKRLKQEGLWLNKVKVFYPFLGNNAESNKYNLVTPIDSDISNRITWNGGVIFSTDGIKGNRVNAYGDTHKIIDTEKGGFSSFIISGIAEASDTMGARNADSTSMSLLETRWTDNKFYSRVHSSSSGSIINNSSSGFYANTRLAISGMNSFVMNLRGANYLFSIDKSLTSNENSVYILTSNWNGSPTSTRFSSATIGCATIHENMTANDLKILENIVLELQINLGRI